MSADELTIAEWTEMPYTSHDLRGAVVEHRVVVAAYDGVGADVRHEVRSVDVDRVPSTWTEAEVIEARPHGLSRVDGVPEW
ncbi:hypothetical protein [Halobaculum sp. EA56]|uniref:hypothetical protein n=1 Tax=Halobaculum sp. EA56 TaxID=3421648 RepID=UPI003EB83369